MPRPRTLLATYLAKPNAPSIGEFAAKVGADRTRIHRCMKGERRPGLDLAIAIERETKGEVPVESWSDERPLNGPLRPAASRTHS